MDQMDRAEEIHLGLAQDLPILCEIILSFSWITRCWDRYHVRWNILVVFRRWCDKPLTLENKKKCAKVGTEVGKKKMIKYIILLRRKFGCWRENKKIDEDKWERRVMKVTSSIVKRLNQKVCVNPEHTLTCFDSLRTREEEAGRIGRGGRRKEEGGHLRRMSFSGYSSMDHPVPSINGIVSLTQPEECESASNVGQGGWWWGGGEV